MSTVFIALAGLAGALVGRAVGRADSPLMHRISGLAQPKAPPEAPGRSEPTYQPSSAPEATAQTDDISPLWFATPGGRRLELGSSGFFIELHTEAGAHPFHGFSPEGYRFGVSAELRPMKLYLQHRAQEREEFTYTGRVWTSASKPQP